MTDTLGVEIEAGDVVTVTAWGDPIRLIDTGRRALVDGFTTRGNVRLSAITVLDAADPIARGRAVSPGMLAVARCDGTPGHEGNRPHGRNTMSTMTDNVTRKQAEAALAAVKAQFEAYVTDQHYPATPAETIDGVDYPATRDLTIPAGPPPVLVEDVDGQYGMRPGWVILWEEGPDEWPFVLGTNEATEEERVLAAAAAEEFGATTGDLTKSGRTPAKMPEGLWWEPINHCSIGLYPA